ncbi:dihydroxyacetone kinase subunit L [Salibacterium salarium]|uniref:phosphoenolpyruvate--glycerone phosphotransferase n=1 Tax=Salibacterium salarium TaxID=284579 RepID=A0A3R9QGX7_9BACI|nr:dihydroxyacetone kinase subunit DhaL [Salibacterium salarium]RSL30295.1 dihydroxyacetone kinase subunit L [Salibacterium salarium]
MDLSVQDLKRWLHLSNQKIQENKAFLSELDQPIGDGDHGHNMARGFQEVAEKIESKGYEETGALMKDAAMTLISKVGGAAGPLYGTAFLKAADEWKGETSLTDDAFVRGLEAAVEGLRTRGKADRGGKTLLDVWLPVLDYGKENKIEPDDLKQVAIEGMQRTNGMQAKKGRAAYFREQSTAHIDPGAYSSYLLFEAWSESMNKEENAHA